ncbi:MAG: hypothetical protein QM783_11940 [Phycisphaerales bacterium]
MKSTCSIALILPALILFAGCSSDPQPLHPQAESGVQAPSKAAPSPIERRNRAAAAFLRRTSVTAHPADPAHCRMLRTIAEAFVADSKGPVLILADDAEVIGQADAAAAERAFVALAAAAQREIIRDRTLAGADTADVEAALAAIQSLTPMISVPANASAGAPTAALGQAPAAASDDREKNVDDYLKRRGFKEHPGYTPSN